MTDGGLLDILLRGTDGKLQDRFCMLLNPPGSLAAGVAALQQLAYARESWQVWSGPRGRWGGSRGQNGQGGGAGQNGRLNGPHSRQDGPRIARETSRPRAWPRLGP